MIVTHNTLLKNIFVNRLVFFTILAFYSSMAHAQQITGVWKGKIDKKKVELKIIQNGDSLTGTSYYYESENNYRRYSIKGYFDEKTNSAVWWDDQLLEEKTGKNILGTPGKVPLLSVADFNCPGGGKMLLEGKAAKKENRKDIKGPVDLQKEQTSLFEDEWDYVIENYTVGSNDPYIIDSIASIAFIPPQTKTEIIMEEKKEIVDVPVEIKKPANETVKKIDHVVPERKPTEEKKVAVIKQPTIEEKFISREKVFNTEILVEGDSVELRFYDNAEIDGDSISLFLNDRLIFEHIRLTEKAFTIKLPVNELGNNNELIMVAENLGLIPPNTSYMVCLVGEKRYEVKLASTENSSAMIRLKKSPL